MNLMNFTNLMNLKNLIIYLLFILFCFTISVQAQSERESADLVLELKVLPNYPIGYATCYQGVISKVIKGKLSEKYLLMTVLAGDTTYDKIFNLDPERTNFEIGFNKYKTSEEYRTAFVTGFVDKNRTSWKIIYVKKIEEEE